MIKLLIFISSFNVSYAESKNITYFFPQSHFAENLSSKQKDIIETSQKKLYRCLEDFAKDKPKTYFIVEGWSDKKNSSPEFVSEIRKIKKTEAAFNNYLFLNTAGVTLLREGIIKGSREGTRADLSDLRSYAEEVVNKNSKEIGSFNLRSKSEKIQFVMSGGCFYKKQFNCSEKLIKQTRKVTGRRLQNIERIVAKKIKNQDIAIVIGRDHQHELVNKFSVDKYERSSSCIEYYHYLTQHEL